MAPIADETGHLQSVTQHRFPTLAFSVYLSLASRPILQFTPFKSRPKVILAAIAKIDLCFMLVD